MVKKASKAETKGTKTKANTKKKTATKKTTAKKPAASTAKKASDVAKAKSNKKSGKPKAVASQGASDVAKAKSDKRADKKAGKPKKKTTAQEVTKKTITTKVKVEKTPVAKKTVEAKTTQAAPKQKTPRIKTVKPAIVAHTVGRRKSSVARVWLTKGSGNIVVNDMYYKEYFDTNQMRLDAYKPFDVIPQAQEFDVKAIIVGGGKVGQAGALKVGIARSLALHDSSLRSELRKFDLLTRDSRVKERKKPGRKKARRRFQFVKR